MQQQPPRQPMPNIPVLARQPPVVQSPPPPPTEPTVKFVFKHPEIVSFVRQNQIYDYEMLFLKFLQTFDAKATPPSLTNDELQRILSEVEHNNLVKKTLQDQVDNLHKAVHSIKTTDSETILFKRFGTGILLTCEICNQFRVSTRKGLAAHKRKCGRTCKDSGEDDEETTVHMGKPSAA